MPIEYVHGTSNNKHNWELMTMTMNQLRNAAGDCKTTNRWATVGSSTVRIISVGRSKVRLLFANGTVKTVEPADIQAAW